MGPAGIHIVKGMAEALKILIGKARDQIQMNVDILSCQQAFHVSLQPSPLHRAPYRVKGLHVRGLDAHFQLNQARPHSSQKFQFFLRQNVSCDFKVEIGLSVIMFQNVAPDLHGMPVVAVEGSIHEFHLRNFFVQKKLQFLLYQLQIPKTHRLINGRQTVAAAIGASS